MYIKNVLDGTSKVQQESYGHLIICVRVYLKEYKYKRIYSYKYLRPYKKEREHNVEFFEKEKRE